MGEITIEIELENAGDRAVYEQGYVEESARRTYRLVALVDTGAVMLVLPQNVVERLGLRTQRTVIVPYADERKEERPVAGPLTITIGESRMWLDRSRPDQQCAAFRPPHYRGHWERLWGCQPHQWRVPGRRGAYHGRGSGCRACGRLTPGPGARRRFYHRITSRPGSSLPARAG